MQRSHDFWFLTGSCILTYPTNAFQQCLWRLAHRLIHALHFSTPLLNATPSHPRFRRDPTIVIETATTLPPSPRLSWPCSATFHTACFIPRYNSIHTPPFINQSNVPERSTRRNSSYQTTDVNTTLAFPPTNRTIPTRYLRALPRLSLRGTKGQYQKKGIRILEKRGRKERKRTVRSKRVARRGPKGREKEKGRVWWRTTRPQRSFQEQTLWTSCKRLKMDESNLVCRSYRYEYVFQAAWSSRKALSSLVKQGGSVHRVSGSYRPKDRS